MVTRALEQGAAQLLALRPFFHDGWGDHGLIARSREIARAVPPEDEISVAWGSPHERRRYSWRDGEFPSPVAELPPGCRAAHVRLVTPADEARRVVVLMSAWNDHGYRLRMPVARRLARRGIATAMLENPYYGARLPDRDGHPMATVADFFVMGRAAALEGRALAAEFARRGGPGIAAGPAVGVSGYSMGGNIAAFVAAISHVPVAAAPLAASYSPAPVFLDGVIRNGIDWAALDDGRGDPRERLREALGDLSVLRLPAPPHTRHAVLLAGRDDAYVPAAAVLALHEHWPGSELRWIREGHASMRFFRRPTMTGAIVDALDRMEAAGS